MTGFDEALRRQIRRHAASGVSLSRARQAIVADALAAQLVDMLRDFVATLRESSAPMRVQLAGGGRWRKSYSPAGFVVHRLPADLDVPTSGQLPTLRRLALVTTDAQFWVWERGSSPTDPPLSGVVPITGQALLERRLPLEDGRIAVGENGDGQPVAVVEQGEPPWETVDQVLARIADRIGQRGAVVD